MNYEADQIYNNVGIMFDLDFQPIMITLNRIAFQTICR